ncbi:MAG TPA: hypothetical protein VFO08_15375 [Methylomirabilota bacterium]|jgi:hypothetical protein|nr:hypothetical protein [Methylomirabilota bacterium]
MGRGRRRFVFALVLLLIPAAPAWAADQAWLLGRWELLRDPDGGAQDWIEFAADGHVAVAKRNGRRFTGRYHASDESVQIDYKIGSESVITTLRPSTDKRELYARSAVTGKNAVYEKRP